MKDGCPFCDFDGAVLERFNWLGGYKVVVFEPLHPVTPGHLLVVPERHVTDAAEDPILTGTVFEIAAMVGGRSGEPFNLITSAGAEATQTVFHLHAHIVPRREDDELKLPWSEVKVDWSVTA